MSKSATLVIAIAGGILLAGLVQYAVGWATAKASAAK